MAVSIDLVSGTPTTDDMQIYINQINTLLSTPPGSVIGSPDMGYPLDHIVFTTETENSSVERDLYEKVQRWCTHHSKFTTIIKVRFSKGTIRDIAYIDITINDKKITYLVK